MAFVRRVAESALVVFLTGLPIAIFHKHLILALILGAVVCVIVIWLVTIFERPKERAAVVKRKGNPQPLSAGEKLILQPLWDLQKLFPNMLPEWAKEPDDGLQPPLHNP
jgi:hypothetical protein